MSKLDQHLATVVAQTLKKGATAVAITALDAEGNVYHQHIATPTDDLSEAAWLSHLAGYVEIHAPSIDPIKRARLEQEGCTPYTLPV